MPRISLTSESARAVPAPAPRSTVNNHIAPLGAEPFLKQGWGVHMLLHVYDVMWPGYIPPTRRENFTATVSVRGERGVLSERGGLALCHHTTAPAPYDPHHRPDTA